mmetsp:Transcript_28044/g.64198  ORF Transcript_28044/g.64198 Transcript_28044/m.64198 type:complete len:373 (-) Transcript_28044:179-1297(-)|eukprot:CAMPEP_0113314360 /NCGR_PEP_ID=MMETSP0010_2-20120614/10449_1 /TAXON_ID=216773 ORGANISM="Corethron hystrix, Strain 308" /NCGR_SAMPLE_ID=MMETSP0010_2 /ASSEMBLY_ACC=CAM_ASM_000155 /LENGTH=372 /DNA_ID=CAMNT_0000170625 /DNA_START=97 /DNA_END=1215 /DNA_ORIENTATION=- /assembly_acc=CAM_ASM_000155
MLKSLVLAAALLSGLTGASANIKSNSRLGRSLLSSARKLEDADEVDYSYVADYSIKFQGCHHVSQWNAEVDEDNDVRLQTVRLARFRLCASDSCSDDKTAGCSSGYGDYIIDLDTFVQSYLEDKQQTEEYNCQVAQENSGCDGDDVDDEDTCMYNYYNAQGLDYCVENEDGEEQFDVQDYAQCAQVDFAAEDDDGNRKRNLDEAEEIQYFVGAYCAEQGGEVRLGLFTDDTCTTESETSYYSLAGESLPYSTESLISDNCISCVQPEEDNGDENGDDAQEEVRVKEMCEQIYEGAGKCETYMGIQYPSENACNYIAGIKITREDGIVLTESTRSSKGASVAIGLFATTAILLGAYVYYLRTKLGGTINLSSM